ncbi:MAG: type II toxin-antitoxin system HicB family antitoxin [Patescibacteria group bacterium]
MSKIDFKSVVWKEGQYYVSQCLDVDVSSFGKTRKEALSMLQDALELYFEDIPFPTKTARAKRPFIASITLQHA